MKQAKIGVFWKCAAPAAAIAALIAVVSNGPATAQMSSQRSQSSEQYAQPTDTDNLRNMAAALNARRGDFFKKKDLKGLADLYTPDASYVELLPKLDVMSGRAQIQQHLQEVLQAGGSDITPTVTSAEMSGKDTLLVAGEYNLTAKGKRITGRFFQTLRRDGGTWRIASHVFARPEPVTAGEVAAFRGN